MLCGRGIVRSSTHRNAHSMMNGENTIAAHSLLFLLPIFASVYNMILSALALVSELSRYPPVLYSGNNTGNTTSVSGANSCTPSRFVLTIIKLSIPAERNSPASFVAKIGYRNEKQRSTSVLFRNGHGRRTRSLICVARLW